MEIIVKDLSKKFKKVTVLENINVKFESGKIYGIVGRNGCGKTTLLNAILGNIPMEKGVEEEDFQFIKEGNPKIGYIIIIKSINITKASNICKTVLFVTSKTNSNVTEIIKAFIKAIIRAKFLAFILFISTFNTFFKIIASVLLYILFSLFFR